MDKGSLHACTYIVLTLFNTAVYNGQQTVTLKCLEVNRMVFGFTAYIMCTMHVYQINGSSIYSEGWSSIG